MRKRNLYLRLISRLSGQRTEQIVDPAISSLPLIDFDENDRLARAADLICALFCLALAIVLSVASFPNLISIGLAVVLCLFVFVIARKLLLKVFALEEPEAHDILGSDGRLGSRERPISVGRLRWAMYKAIKADYASDRFDPFACSQPYVFLKIADDDPELAMAGFRMQLDNHLRQIAEKKNVVLSNNNTFDILNSLQSADIFSEDQLNALHELRQVLNKAIHGAFVEDRAEASRWIKTLAPQLLRKLQEEVSSSKTNG